MDDWLDTMKADDGFAERMIAQHRCGACGCKVEPYYRGKGMPLGWPKECPDCRRAARHPFIQIRDRFGAHQASIHHELQRRMGYPAAQQGGPTTNEDE